MAVAGKAFEASRLLGIAWLPTRDVMFALLVLKEFADAAEPAGGGCPLPCS